MHFLPQIFHMDKLLRSARLLLMSFILVLFGCGGSSSPSLAVVTKEVVTQPILMQSEGFSGESYNLVTLDGYQESGLQAYWPAGSKMPVALQESLQQIFPQVSQLFIQQNFAFNQVSENAHTPYYKKVFFLPNASEESDISKQELIGGFSIDGSLSVTLDVDNLPKQALFFSQLTQLVYQSERYKYQPDKSVLEHLVSRGLALHFLQENLPLEEFTATVDIEQSALKLALKQVKEGLNDDVLADSWFVNKPSSEQLTANAVGYYLAAQHFSYYSGSNAGNSFSVSSELFVPWLIGEDISIKKAHQYVRTSDVTDQIEVSELSRQAGLFLGSYFIEGLNHEKLIALSFDDGPSQYTTQILDVLEQAQVPASFFWQGQNLADYQAVIERSIRAGHTVANHSWNHANGMSYSADDLWQHQVAKTNDEFQQLFNVTPRFYRPPYGEISDAQVKLLAAKGMKVLLWSVDSRDWNPELNSVEKIERELINHQHEEVITLMHDAGGNRQNTVDALPVIIEHYKAQGYRFVNLEDLLGISDKY